MPSKFFAMSAAARSSSPKKSTNNKRTPSRITQVKSKRTSKRRRSLRQALPAQSRGGRGRLMMLLPRRRRRRKGSRSERVTCRLHWCLLKPPLCSASLCSTQKKNTSVTLRVPIIISDKLTTFLIKEPIRMLWQLLIRPDKLQFWYDSIPIFDFC